MEERGGGGVVVVVVVGVVVVGGRRGEGGWGRGGVQEWNGGEGGPDRNRKQNLS